MNKDSHYEIHHNRTEKFHPRKQINSVTLGNTLEWKNTLGVVWGAYKTGLVFGYPSQTNSQKIIFDCCRTQDSMSETTFKLKTTKLLPMP